MITATRRPLLIIVVATIAIELFMIVTGMGPDVLLVAAAAASIGVGAWIVVDIAEATPSVAPIGAAAPRQPEHRVDRRVTRLRSGLAHGQSDQFSAERLHGSLVEIIDDQLMAAHQIDRTSDPDAAATAMGSELARFVDDPAARVSLPGTRELDRILAEIERL
jgi:threonine dehydrogenase-like Zn-dependent dehydrogenase